VTAIYVLTLRQLTGRWRLLILLGLSAVPLVLAAVATAGTDKPSASELDDALVDSLLASAVLPIVVLAVATAALGNELVDKTLANLTLTPLARWRIVLAKLAAAVTVSLPLPVAGAAAGVLVGFQAAGIDGAGRAAIAAVVALAAGVAMYSAVFLWAGLVTAHPLAFGLLYVFVWEGLFATFVNGIKYVSIRQYTLGWVKGIDGSRFGGPDQDVLGLAGAVAGSLVVLVGFVALAVRRLRRMDVP
jgi:ABC-type transport system involved in multi-copper enzyme maturation permease subunit